MWLLQIKIYLHHLLLNWIQDYHTRKPILILKREKSEIDTSKIKEEQLLDLEIDKVREEEDMNNVALEEIDFAI